MNPHLFGLFDDEPTHQDIFVIVKFPIEMLPHKDYPHYYLKYFQKMEDIKIKRVWTSSIWKATQFKTENIAIKSFGESLLRKNGFRITKVRIGKGKFEILDDVRM
jgi:hypothetical protein